MKLIASNKGFDVYFNANTQTYSVFKDARPIITGKSKFSDVKSYIE